MKLFVTAFLAGLLPFAQAAEAQKSVIVTYPQDTPDSVLTTAKNALVDAGGIITHEYNLIKGFAAKASANVLESLTTKTNAYSPNVEEDQVVTVKGGSTESDDKKI